MWYCHIGYWENTLTLSPCPEDERLFVSLGPMTVLIMDRIVAVIPDPDGNVAVHENRERQGGLGLVYQWHVNVQPWPRFMRHEVEIDMDDDGTVTWELPSDYRLPWPRLLNTGNFDAPAVAQRELYLRGRSAFLEDGEEGLKRVLRNVPENIKRFLLGSIWSHTIQRIKKERY